jgi:hypothetical protein
MKKNTSLNVILGAFLFAGLTVPMNISYGATARSLITVNDSIKGTLPVNTVDLIRDAEGCFLKARFYEANSDSQQADLYFKKGVIALAKAEDSKPGVGEELIQKLSNETAPVKYSPGKIPLNSSLVIRNTIANLDSMTVMRSGSSNPSNSKFRDGSVPSETRSKSSKSGSKYDKSSHKSKDEEKADKARRELDENYDRAKKGSKVLQWGLKILNKIPVVKNFIPGGGEQTAEAADKVGNKITAPRDGHAMINGELKVWNKKKGRWEDF